MLAKATQLCNAKLGIMWSYDGEAFTIAAERGTPPPSTVFGDTLARPGPTTALGRVQREKRVLHIPDMMDEEAYRDGDPMQIASVDALGMRSWLGVPLLKEGKLLGVVTIYRGEVRPFSDKEIALLTSFAEQAVIAIENVRLFEEVQARTRELARSVSRAAGSGRGDPRRQLDARPRDRAQHDRRQGGAAFGALTPARSTYSAICARSSGFVRPTA